MYIPRYYFLLCFVLTYHILLLQLCSTYNVCILPTNSACFMRLFATSQKIQGERFNAQQRNIMPTLDEASTTSSVRKTTSSVERKLSQEERLIKKQIIDIEDQLRTVREKIKNLPPLRSVYEAPGSPKNSPQSKDKKKKAGDLSGQLEISGERNPGDASTTTLPVAPSCSSSSLSMSSSESLLKSLPTDNEEDNRSVMSYHSVNRKYLYKDYGGKKNSNIMMHLLDKMPVTEVPPKSSHCLPLCFQHSGSDTVLDADQLSLSKASGKSTPKSSRRNRRSRNLTNSMGNSFTSGLDSPGGSFTSAGNMEFSDDMDSFKDLDIDDAACDDLSFDESVPEKFEGLQEFVTDVGGEPAIALVLVDIIKGENMSDGFKFLTEPVVTLYLGSQTERSSPFYLGSGVDCDATWNERRTLSWNGKDRLRVAVNDRGESPVMDSRYIGTCIDLGKLNLGVTSEIHEELGDMVFVDSRVHARIGEKNFGTISFKVTIRGVVFPEGIENEEEFLAMKARSYESKLEIDTGMNED